MSPADAPAVAGSARTAGEALTDAVAALREAGSPSARLDAEVLVAWALERDRAWLLAHLDEPMPEQSTADLSAWVERRSRGEPIAYIRGFKEWYGLRIATDDRALIPRPETELLVDAAVGELADRLVRDDRPIVAWEVGTGSGAVAVAVARRFRTALALGRLRLIVSDASPDAMELASDNLTAHGVAHLVTEVVADLLDAVGSLPPPDVVIANLPYLRSDEVAAGAGSLAWEPAAALDGGADGLSVLRALIARLPRRLSEDGCALLEVGAGQVDPIRDLVATLPGRWSVAATRDLAGVERIVRIERVP
ncbi:MAG TPA: HemK/PrmC family methyltransferase [Candidatus Limnocylindria bacterium]|nr:HemK/PrmC family methyltransferase [Candidatus Limnocylindria bacterium]